MADDAAQIRDLIERWARAVHSGNLDAVLADHADDIVMFDVPPPEDGVRGIQAYRDTWPPFFEWQAQGASFDIVELDVTAGDRVAYTTRSRRRTDAARSRRAEARAVLVDELGGGVQLGAHGR